MANQATNSVDKWQLSLQAEETFALSRAVLDARTLVTHVQADQDALASVVLAQLHRDIHGVPFAEVNFVPGSIKDFSKDKLALDIGDARGIRSTPRGGMMIKASAAGGSCCLAVLRLLPKEERSVLAPYIEEISLADESGQSTALRMAKKYRIWGNEVDRAALTQTSTGFQFQAQRRVMSDYRMYENMWADIYGRLQLGDERKSALSIKDPWKDVMSLFGGRFAVLPVGASLNHAQLLESFGVEVTFHTRALYVTKDCWSLGFHRSNSANQALNFEELFQGLLKDFPGICVKPFFVGWGSKGGGLKCSEVEMRAIRDRILNHVQIQLGIWYGALRH